MASLYGCAGRLTAPFGASRPGQTHTLSDSYDDELICYVSALTGGQSCNDFCRAQGRDCLRGMDNINTNSCADCNDGSGEPHANGDTRADGTCGVGGDTPSCDAGQSAEDCDNGCAQNWVGQICGVSDPNTAVLMLNSF